MKKFLFTFFLLLPLLNLFAQIYITDPSGEKILTSGKSQVVMDDMDYDGILDSLYYDFQNDSIIFLLSSLNFTPLKTDFYPDYCLIFIGSEGGVFYFVFSHMRTVEHQEYQFDKTKKDFRLIKYANESYGNALHDGSGICEFDLLTGEYTINMYYIDWDLDSLLSLPTVNGKMTFDPVYLNDSIWTEPPYASIYTKNKLLDMIEIRVNKLDFDKLLYRQKEQFADFESTRNFTIEYLIDKYGEPLNLYLTSPFKPPQDDEVFYKNRIFQLYQLDTLNVYLLSFRYLSEYYYIALYIDRGSQKKWTKQIKDISDVEKFYNCIF